MGLAHSLSVPTPEYLPTALLLGAITAPRIWHLSQSVLDLKVGKQIMHQVPMHRTCSTTEVMTTAYHYIQMHIHRNVTGLYMQLQGKACKVLTCYSSDLCSLQFVNTYNNYSILHLSCNMCGSHGFSSVVCMMLVLGI